MSNIAYLQLMQLCDSAVPIGSAAHSFGLEGLIEERGLDAAGLDGWLRDSLVETGRLDAAFCREAYALDVAGNPEWSDDWLALNRLASAMRPAHETRAASSTLGRRFLSLAADLTANADLFSALDAASRASVAVHHATAFGLTGRALGLECGIVADMFTQQAAAAMVSAAQRLLPIGQSQASRLMWDLKSAILSASAAGTEKLCFNPMLEIASMRHPDLRTRLFVS